MTNRITITTQETDPVKAAKTIMFAGDRVQAMRGHRVSHSTGTRLGASARICHANNDETIVSLRQAAIESLWAI